MIILTNSSSVLKNIFIAVRPKTLTAAVVPVIVGTSFVIGQGIKFNWGIPLFIILAAVFIQIGTNFINDAVDFKKGADTEERIGPIRVTQKGLFTSKQVFFMGSLFFLAALLCGIPLVIQGGFPILILGLISIFLGYLYTAGPYPLAYLGLGDLFVIFFFGVFAVLGVVYLLTGTWIFSAFLLGLQIGFLATALIALNNLRDLKTDLKVNKKTLAVRLGKKFAKYEILFLLTVPFLIGSYWLLKGSKSAAFFLPLLCLPLAYSVIQFIFQNEASILYNKVLSKIAILHFLFGILISIGFIFI